MRRLVSGLALVISLCAAPWAASGPHPFHDDGGAINWRASLQVAVGQASTTGKPLFIEVCKEPDANAKKLAATTFQDARIAFFINHYFIPVVVDAGTAPADIKALLAKTGGKTEPYLLILDSRSQFIDGASGYKKPNEVEEKILKVLTEKYAISKTQEETIGKQVEELKKLFEGKDYAKAMTLYRSITGVKGYSVKKDEAYEALDLAQSEISTKLKDALDHAKKSEFVDGKKDLEFVLKTKEYQGLPLADSAKSHLAALKLYESAANLAAKDATKAQAVGPLDTLLRTYADTPYSQLATQKKKELTDPKAKK